MSTCRNRQTSVATLRLGRGTLVVVMALGLVSMHGLAGAAPVAVNTHQRSQHNTVPTAFLAGTTVGAVPAHETSGTSGKHDLLHALGQTCIWLLVSGALLFLGRWLGRALTARVGDIVHGQHAGRAPPPTLDHPPDPRLATVILRC